MSGQMYIAVQSGSSEVDGEDLIFKKDITLVEEGHPLLANCPDYFVPVQAHSHYETSTTERPKPSRSRQKGQ